MTLDNTNVPDGSVVTVSINILNQASDTFSSIIASLQVYYDDGVTPASEISIGSPSTIGMRNQTIPAGQVAIINFPLKISKSAAANGVTEYPFFVIYITLLI
jgi:hypothetical protein